VRYEDHIRAAGFNVQLIKNQGKAAAMQRVQVARRWFPRMWFDADKTHAARKMLALYHEQKNKTTGIGMGPMHDEASHTADSFGLMAAAYREPTIGIMPKPKTNWVV
jgi:phage terminase large subunit